METFRGSFCQVLVPEVIEAAECNDKYEYTFHKMFPFNMEQQNGSLIIELFNSQHDTQQLKID